MADIILVVAAHPDDEVFGCGGTIAAHVSKGDSVNVLIMAEGITSRDNTRKIELRDNELENLAGSAKKANDILGVQSLTLLSYPDNRMDSINRLDVIKSIEQYIDKFEPSVVYTHSRTDLNVDHRVINDAVMAACRPLPNSRVNQILFFEVASSTGWNGMEGNSTFSPNWYVDISGTLGKKTEALGAYSSEMRDWPHARSLDALKNLAKWRGASVGIDAAEAFYLARNIIRK